MKILRNMVFFSVLHLLPSHYPVSIHRRTYCNRNWTRQDGIWRRTRRRTAHVDIGDYFSLKPTNGRMNERSTGCPNGCRMLLLFPFSSCSSTECRGAIVTVTTRIHLVYHVANHGSPRQTVQVDSLNWFLLHLHFIVRNSGVTSLMGWLLLNPRGY